MIRELSFTNSRNQKLRGSLHVPSEPSGQGVIVCHGMLSNRSSIKHQSLCRALTDRGLMSLRFDFSGRGESEGTTEEISYERQVDDLSCAFDLMRKEVDTLSLTGSSMGGAVVVLFAGSEKRIRRVVGIATVGRPMEVLKNIDPHFQTESSFQRSIERWKQKGHFDIAGHRIGFDFVESAQGVDVLAAARSIDCPVLLIHGKNDDVVPLSQAVELKSAAKQCDLVVLEEGDHVLHGSKEHQILVRSVVDFLGDEI